jgi:hypothetical protein
MMLGPLEAVTNVLYSGASIVYTTRRVRARRWQKRRCFPSNDTIPAEPHRSSSNSLLDQPRGQRYACIPTRCFGAAFAEATTRPKGMLGGSFVVTTIGRHHEERPHQGLGNELVAPRTAVIGSGRILGRERLGGLLKFYDREAA